MITAVWAALTARAPEDKCARVAALAEPEDGFDPPVASLDWSQVPGRPATPALVAPRDVPRRGLGSREGRGALVHAVAHIEFNAINLALDAMLRFPGLPTAYYRDWLSVARDEARHFQMLSQRLAELGFRYGDFPAHNGLWEAAEKTAHDPLIRMACVPRVLEARGLDVTPGMIERLQQAGDADSIACLDIILREEVRHVAIGSHWYRWLCDQRGLDADALFPQLLAEQGMQLHPPFNLHARAAAGFSATELARLGG
ncbi:ferritin-like domain-containing protein [Flagellatimonas centrodinii]|uniref:ferritin-like domain-containing protein n=1 Tax=Flagellatimonas centrodinii TaxID=2806210 RepID=UPI001FEF7AF9|nr:ferritin-like domain-containing protein [Flagellatimonas centrodinii]ULQ46361.1 ferritin-like domain-containing protein [Flagellatimonas centrodinii]